MTESIFLIYVYALHTLADFVFQTRWMAENKSKSLKALSLHIAEYTGIIFIGMILILPLQYAALYSLVNGCIHFFTDFVTSKISSKAYKSENIKLFWITIGIDQFIHISSLLLTLVPLIEFAR